MREIAPTEIAPTDEIHSESLLPLKDATSDSIVCSPARKRARIQGFRQILQLGLLAALFKGFAGFKAPRVTTCHEVNAALYDKVNNYSISDISPVFQHRESRYAEHASIIGAD